MKRTIRKEGYMLRKFKVALLTTVLILTFGMVVQAEDYKTPALLVSEAKAVIKEVSVQDLKKMMDSNEDIIILDIRDRDEYEKQRIPGAIHMSRGLVDLHVEEIIPDKNAKIVLV
jgi:hypothetical protein